VTTANVLTAAVGRSCYWSPDYSWLSLLKPQAGRTLQVSGPLQINQQDAANQNLAASTSVFANFTANTITAGVWTPPLPNQAVLIENLRCWIQATDNSGKLELQNAACGLGDGFSFVALVASFAMPFTYPALTNTGAYYVSAQPIPLLIPRPVPAVNGPNAFFWILNTDGAGAHTYKRGIAFTYRIIDNVDFSSGPSIPGAGVGL
jgi:hypothetical protein